jgi:hypothetical protein
MNVPTQPAQSSENSTETVLNARRRRSPIGTVHNDIPARLRAHMVPCDLPGEPPCLWCAAADEIERLRDKVQDLRMDAQQDAAEIERLWIKGNELRTELIGAYKRLIDINLKLTSHLDQSLTTGDNRDEDTHA